VPYFDVVENVYLGRRLPRRRLGLDRAAMRREVSRLVDELAPGLPLDRAVSRLSPGQQQMAEILRAFLGDVRILVLDEPTAALGDGEVRRLFDAIGRLRRDGVAIVYVSHRLEEALALCDRATVLRDGRVVATEPCAGLDARRLVALMSGDHPPRPATVRPALGTPLLRLRPDGGDQEVVVRRGEVVGLYGLLGAGRSRLLHGLFGAATPVGAASLAGVAFAPRSPAAAIRAGVVLVPEDRAGQGLVLRHGVRANVALPLLRRFRWFARLPLPAPAREREFALSLRARVRARFADPEQPVGRLSGGNQQKLLLGRWLAQRNQVYLLDEPTRGIDVAAKAELHARIRELAAEGAAVLLATSDMQELLALSDRILVLRAGRVVADLAAADTSARAVLEASYGG